MSEKPYDGVVAIDVGSRPISNRARLIFLTQVQEIGGTMEAILTIFGACVHGGSMWSFVAA